MKLREGALMFLQEKVGENFILKVGESTDYEKDLWAQCKKVIWPKDDYQFSEGVIESMMKATKDRPKDGKTSKADA